MMATVFHKMFVIILLLFLSGCCLFRPSEINTIKSVKDVIKCDSSIVSYIDKHWYPEREKKCHPFDGIYFSIAFKYKECFIGIDERDLILILGKSISTEPDKVIYRISSDCDNYIMNQYFLTFTIDKLTRKVSDVNLSGSKISE